MQLFAQITNDGTAMSETALCVHHLATHKTHFEVDHDYEGGPAKDGPRFELTDTSFHDCTGNDILSCNVCGASNDAPDLIGKTIDRMDFGTVEGAYGDEPCIRLYFSDGTEHGFVIASGD